MIFHWSYILVIPGIILGIWAQAKVKSSFKKYSQVPSARGITAIQAARTILDSAGLNDVEIEHVKGNLTDHYDPRTRTLRLSDQVINSPSIAAIGIAAHEAGHAVQHAKSYAPFSVRSSIAPVAQFGSSAWFWIFLAGLFLSIPILTKVGILLFVGIVVFQLVTLPVEFNASSRAMTLISSNGLLVEEETSGAKKVLSAAALTYVAALAMSVLHLIHLLIYTND